MKTRSQIYKYMYDVTGEMYQLTIAQEELGELIQAISKYKRHIIKKDLGMQEGNLEREISKIAEEIGDVGNCLFGLANHLGIQKEVKTISQEKILRTYNRQKNG